MHSQVGTMHLTDVHNYCHQMVNHDSVLDCVVVSNLIGHCVKHTQYPSNVAHVIASVANLLSLVQPQTTYITAQQVS